MCVCEIPTPSKASLQFTFHALTYAFSHFMPGWRFQPHTCAHSAMRQTAQRTHWPVLLKARSSMLSLFILLNERRGKVFREIHFFWRVSLVRFLKTRWTVWRECVFRFAHGSEFVKHLRLIVCLSLMRMINTGFSGQKDKSVKNICQKMEKKIYLMARAEKVKIINL